MYTQWRSQSLRAMLATFLLWVAPPEIPAITLEYEAEAGLFEGGAKAVFMESASGGACAGYLHLNGAGVTIPNVLGGEGGEKSLTIRFASDAHKVSKVLYVNGDTLTLKFPYTGGYRIYKDTTVKVHLTSKRGNTISFRQDGFPHGLNIDKISIDYGTDILSMTKGTLVSIQGAAFPHSWLARPYFKPINHGANLLAYRTLPLLIVREDAFTKGKEQVGLFYVP